MSEYKGKHEGLACVIDYDKGRHYQDFKIEDVESVDVTVLTGDEIVTFNMRNGNQITVDAGDYVGGRLADFHDGHYTVDLDKKDNRLKWHQRNSAYEALYHLWI